MLEGRRLLAADFGDAPAPYSTLLDEGGPSHEAIGPLLGQTRSIEVDGLPSATADADPSDDGVSFDLIRVGQLDAALTVNVTNAPVGAKLDAWIDFNGDGSWGGVGERIFASSAVVEGDNQLTFDVPTDALSGNTFARFRLSTLGDLGVGGEALDGEVEDYAVTIEPTIFPTAFNYAGVLTEASSNTATSHVIDVDGDGDLDLVTTRYIHDNRITWHENDGDRNFVEYLLTGTSDQATAIAPYDVDGDGDIDIAWASSITNVVGWYENNGAQSFSAHIITTNAVAINQLRVIEDSMIGVSLGTGKIHRFLNDGNGVFTYGAWSSGLPSIKKFAFGKIDSRYSFELFMEAIDGDLYRFEDGYRNQLLISERVKSTSNLEYVDYDKDGRENVVLIADNQLVAFESRKSATPQFLFGLDAGYTKVTSGDLDRDGDIDFLLAKPSGSDLLWLVNDGNQFFQPRYLRSDIFGVADIHLVDMNGDNGKDIVVNSSVGGVTLNWFQGVTEASIIASSPKVLESIATSPYFEFRLSSPRAVPTPVRFEVSGISPETIRDRLLGLESSDGLEATVVIPAGELTHRVTLVIVDNETVNADRPVTLTLLDSEDYAGSELSQATITTYDDDLFHDFGDAPAPYPTLITNGRAAHRPGGPTSPRLGNAVSYEQEGKPSSDAQGDDGEDGVTFAGLRVGNTQAQVELDVQQAGGKIDAWIDFNGNGSWSDPGEHIVSGRSVPTGITNIAFAVPSNAQSGTTYARVRVSTLGSSRPIGLAADGEVEDYQLTIDPPAPTTFFGQEHVIATLQDPNSFFLGAGGLPEIEPLDFDQDGDIDFISNKAITIDGQRGIFWFQNNRSGEFTPRQAIPSHNITSAVVVDFDHDGDLDIVTLNTADNILLHTNDGNQSFSVSSLALTQPGITVFDVIDIDQDGDLDVLFYSNRDNTISWLNNTPTGIAGKFELVANVFDVTDIATADIDQDGDLDFITSGDAGQPFLLYKNVGGSYARQFLFDRQEQISKMELVDIDGDSDLDILYTATAFSIADNSARSAEWLEQGDDGSFTRRIISSALKDQVSISTGDLNGDGLLDVVTTSTGNGRLQWHENNGQAGFATPVQLPAIATPLFATSFDIDRDGDLDIVSVDDQGQRVVWYENSISAELISAPDVVIESDSRQYAYQFELSAPRPHPVSLLLRLSGTAEIGNDYLVSGATSPGGGGLWDVVVPAGSTTATVLITVPDDSAIEEDKTISLEIIQSNGYELGEQTTATTTVIDDDAPREYGDAPAPYPTSLLQGQAVHKAGTENTPRLGTSIDYETQSFVSSDASGDPSDDGVTFGEIQVGALGATITVNVQGSAGQLDAWLDFNGDGSWGGPGEQLFDSRMLDIGDNVLHFDVPSNAVSGSTFARFRISTEGDLGVIGQAQDGEVEDYQLTISPPLAGEHFNNAMPIDTQTRHRARTVTIDFDQDGDLDIIAKQSGRSVYWYENEGTDGYTEHVLIGSWETNDFGIADLDADGDLDVYGVGSRFRRLTWHINDGEQSFTTHIVPDITMSGTSIKAGDLNNDGHLDLIVASSVEDSLVWFEGDGAGNYLEHALRSGTNGSSDFDVADIDRDGDLDILASFTGTAELVWLDNSGGNFTERLIEADSSVEAGVHLGDLDGDGHMDFLASSSNLLDVDQSLVFYKNHGDSTFSRSPIAETGTGTPRTTLVDLDGDHNLDLLTTYSGESSIYWYRNTGAGTFTEQVLRAETDRPLALHAADNDGDGDLDILATTASGKLAWYRHDVAASVVNPTTTATEGVGQPLLYQFETNISLPYPIELHFRLDGSQTFDADDYTLEGASSFDGVTGTVVLPANETSAVVSLTLLDDGRHELDETVTFSLLGGLSYFVEPDSNSIATTVISSDRGADYGDAPAPYRTAGAADGPIHNESGPDSPRLGSTITYELDGHPVPQADSDRGDDGVTFGKLQVGDSTGTFTVDVHGSGGFIDAWIDFNGDGSWDGAGEKIAHRVMVAEGQTALDFHLPTAVLAGETFARVRVSTEGGLHYTGLAEDGEVEDYAVTIARPPASTGTFHETTLVESLQISGGPYALLTGDIDNDGDVDIVSLTPFLAWYENTGQQHLVEHVIRSAQHFSPLFVSSAELADIDSDGDLDIAFGSARSVGWLENDGSGTFAIRVASDRGSVNGIALGDFNGDSKLDIASAGSESVLYLDVGRQNPVVPAINSFREIGNDTAAVDVDGDGDLDLVTGEYWFLQEDDGSFERVSTNFKTFATNQFLSISDLDGNGKPDAVVINYDSFFHETVEVLEIDPSTSNGVRSRDIDTTDVDRQDVVVADFDGDGDQDIAIAEEGTHFNHSRIVFLWNNAGNFTKEVLYEAETSSERIEMLAATDVDGDGTMDLLAGGGGFGIRLFSQRLAVQSTALAATASESSDESLVFRLSIGAVSPDPLSVPFHLSGTATQLDDYLVVSGADWVEGTRGMATIPAGQDFVDIHIQPRNDNLQETAETVILTPLNVSPNALKSFATGVILGDPTYADYGDAPGPYPTGPSRPGAAHVAVGATLGPLRTTEAVGQASPAALGDVGDDGVTFGEVRVGQVNSQVTVNVQNTTLASKLDAWIDFDGDGYWDRQDEQIFRNVTLQPGDNVLTFSTPAAVKPGATYARFRLSTAGNLAPVGAAIDGEVEDHQLTIAPAVTIPPHFAEQVVTDTSSSVTALATVDIDQDGDLDIITGHSYSQTVATGSVWLHRNNGLQNYTSEVIYEARLTNKSIEVGDIDGDGDLDIAVASNSNFGELVWLRNDGDAFIKQVVIDVNAQPQPSREEFGKFAQLKDIHLADLDNDGDLDIVASSSPDSRFGRITPANIAWYENQGVEYFQRHEISGSVDVANNVRVFDYDQDGDLDVLSSIARGGGVVLYRNNGLSQFVETALVLPETIDDRYYPQFFDANMAATVYEADIDNDGDFDLLITPTEHAPELRWHENLGDGDYAKRTIASGSFSSTDVIATDMDGDGDLDAVFGRHRISATNLGWLENRIVGDFNDDALVDEADYRLWRSAFGSTSGPGLSADSNNDGIVDAADYTVWRHAFDSGKIDRNFFFVTETESFGSIVQSADVDGDGDIDILSPGAGDLTWHVNTTAVTLVADRAPLIEGTAEGWEITVTRNRDFDVPLSIHFAVEGNALHGADFLIEGTESLGEYQGSFLIPAGESSASIQISVVDDELLEFDEAFSLKLTTSDTSYVLSGDTRFESSIVSDEVGGDFGDAPSPYPTSLADNGAYHSAATANDVRLGSTRAETTDGSPSANASGDTTDDGIIFSGMRAGQVDASVTVDVLNGPGWLSGWIDFNGDGTWNGANEIIFADVPVVVGTNLLAFEVPADAALGTTFARFRISTDQGLSPYGIASDGEVEDYAVEISPPTASNPTFSPAQTIESVAAHYSDLVLIDFNGDQKIDLLSSDGQSNLITLHQGNGSLDPISTNLTSSANVVSQIVTSDFNSDGLLDIAYISFSEDYVGWLRSNGDGTYSKRTISFGVGGVADLSAGDLDNDGDTDLLAVSQHDDEVLWFENDGSGNFKRHLISSIDDGASSVAAIDLDRDGDLDVLVRAKNAREILWYENDGTASFSRNVIAEYDGSPNTATTEVEVIDFDHDGDFDLLVSVGDLTANTVVLLENDGSQSFSQVDLMLPEHGFTRLHTSDLDGDGDYDLIAHSKNARTIYWYENTGMHNFEVHTLGFNASEVLEITTGDYDGDGDLDILASSNNLDAIVWFENDFITGDFNRDRVVDEADFRHWRSRIGGTDQVSRRADGNFDGVVDAADYTVWRRALAESSQQEFAIGSKVEEISSEQPTRFVQGLTPPSATAPMSLTNSNTSQPHEVSTRGLTTSASTAAARRDLLLLATDQAFAQEQVLDDDPLDLNRGQQMAEQDANERGSDFIKTRVVDRIFSTFDR